MKYLIIILSIFIISCSSTKVTTETHTLVKKDSTKISHIEKKDSIRIVEKIVYLPAKAGLVVDNPCDSLGNLKPINISTSAGNFKATITSQGNKLKLNIKEIDSLVSVKDKILVIKTKQDSVIASLKEKIKDIKETIIIKYRPTKWTYIFFIWDILATLLIFYSPKKLIAKIFKKQTS